jgi:cbb3-type cytochrome oxidase subunit 3
MLLIAKLNTRELVLWLILFLHSVIVWIMKPETKNGSNYGAFGNTLIPQNL